MIILDTNIVSELMNSSPEKSVFEWLNAQAASSLYLTTITIAEIEYGLNILPDGKRKRQLSKRFGYFLSNAFGKRILSFDESAARLYGEIMGHRRTLGRPISALDGQIASITLCRNFILATRNTKDFDECQIKLINPFIYLNKE